MLYRNQTTDVSNIRLTFFLSTLFSSVKYLSFNNDILLSKSLPMMQADVIIRSEKSEKNISKTFRRPWPL